MELYDEEKEEKKSKAPLIIGICIAILVVMTILVLVGIIYIKDSIVTITYDGIQQVGIEKIFYTEKSETGTQLYVPIIEIAELFSYKGYTGDYENISEDKSKCHVIGKDEIAMFSLDSDILVKKTGNSENEYIKLNQKVFEMNGKLYTTIEGIQKAFNVLFRYDEDFKNIDIYSMESLVTSNAQKLGIEKYSTQFNDKKAIFLGLIIFNENGQYGVIDITTKKPILEAKYQEIKYLPITNEFLVKSNGKYGIVTIAENVTTKVKTIYDEIKIIDNQKGLYLVRKNNAYGVLDVQGKILIEPEYTEIGIKEISEYAQNGVENQYVLLDEIIPVKNQENLWGLFNIKGEKVTDFKYTSIGCKIKQANNSSSVLVIPSHKIIVVNVDKKYNLVTITGKEMLEQNILDVVYLKNNLETGVNEFYMKSGNKTVSVEEWLTSRQ